MRLLYDLAAEVGDVIPLPVNQGTAVEGFSHGTTTVIEKSTINVGGRDLVRQVYRLNYYFAEGPWPEQGKLVEVIEDLGVLELNAQYEKPLPYGIIVDYINPKPLLRCFLVYGSNCRLRPLSKPLYIRARRQLNGFNTKSAIEKSL